MFSSISAKDSDVLLCNDLPSYQLLDFWVGNWDVYVDEEISRF